MITTISFNWINVMSDRTSDKLGDKSGDKLGDNSTDDIIHSLSESQAKILAEIRNNANITIPQIAKNIGMAKSSVDYGISKLKKKKILERAGSNKTGYWKVIE